MEEESISSALIVSAAIRPYNNSRVFTVYLPGDYDEIIKTYGLKQSGNLCYGFLTSDGEFVDREIAAIIALENGQCQAISNPPFLRVNDICTVSLGR